jgi:NADH-quinone oxidoreductase subunit J
VTPPVLSWLAYGALAIALIVSAVMTIGATRPVYSVVWLLAHFVALAVTYLTLTAEFLAVTQIIVYSGAILMLFVFVIALLSSGVAPFQTGPDRMKRLLWPSVALAALAVIVVVGGLSRAPLPADPSAANQATSPAGPAGAADVFGSVADFGKALFTTNLLPFEVTALILMVAVVGVVLLAGDHEPLRPMSRRRGAEVAREEREAILREGR